MSTIVATATRVDGWWAVEFTTTEGPRFTQARRLDQVEGMVRDICAMDDVKVAAVTVEPVTSSDSLQAVREYKEAAETAEIADRAVYVASRRAAHALKDEGLSLRDVGRVMGISHQRAAQLSS